MKWNETIETQEPEHFESFIWDFILGGDFPALLTLKISISFIETPHKPKHGKNLLNVKLYFTLFKSKKLFIKWVGRPLSVGFSLLASRLLSFSQPTASIHPFIFKYENVPFVSLIENDAHSLLFPYYEWIFQNIFSICCWMRDDFTVVLFSFHSIISWNILCKLLVQRTSFMIMF